MRALERSWKRACRKNALTRCTPYVTGIERFPPTIHLVRPAPPDIAHDIVAHVILIQHHQATLCSLLYTIYDYTVPEGWTVIQLATTMHEHVFLEQIIHGLGRTQQCLLAGHNQICHAWHEAHRLQLGTPWPGRDGFGLVITFTFRQEGTSLLQFGRHVHRQLHIEAEEPWSEVSVSSGRQTRGSVAQDHGPEQRQSISLTSLISKDGQTKIVRLMAGHQELHLPTFLEVPVEAGTKEVEQVLLQWGLHCTALRFGEHDRFLCFRHDFSFDKRQWHYMFSNEDVADIEGCFLHTQNEEMKHLDIMQFLDELGYGRAVIISEQRLHLDICHVTFCNSVPQMPAQETRQKTRTPWPERAIWHWQEGPLYSLTEHTILTSPQKVQTEFCSRDIEELIAAGPSFLQTDLAGIELPDYISTSLQPATPGRKYDRWLIFTDGSSLASTRRMAPQQADELGQPDTWAMLVLGELFQEDGQSIIEMIGWCAHPVRYDENGTSFTHACHIGAEVAERQALIWAGLWRMMQNSLTPTTFCCDSMTCGQQAFGNMGTAYPDASYRLLRGIFQSLEQGLPPGHLALHHVYSHTGDPFNEFVDTVAKLEMTASFHHPWPAIDMQKWNEIIPHLWLLHSENCGLPKWNDGTLEVPAPSLPELMKHAQTRPSTSTTMQCTLSLASANVLSISRQPDGHAGKLHYLFAQMKTLGINIMGVQEGRAEEGRTASNQILRFMAGHDRHQCGVEIWVNLEQPYGIDHKGKEIYFKEHHFQIVHKDPRRLLMNLQAEGLQCFLFAAHAPHSGRPREERETWWENTTELLCQQTQQQSCVWLIDANAEPGAADGEVVYKKGLKTSPNTIFMRTALQKLQMCLPSTWPVHEGTLSTWTAPNGEDQHCIDYIAIPMNWKSSCTTSKVLEEFDLATCREDHKAVGIELKWQTEMRRPDSKKRMPSIEWSSSEVREQLLQGMSEVTCVPWTTDVATQEQHFSRQVDKLLRPFCKKTRAGPKKCYITDEIWQQRSQVLIYRKKLKQIKDRLRKEVMYLVFKSWSRRHQPHDIEENFNYGTTLRCSCVRTLSQYKIHRVRLRDMLKFAKHNLMQDRLRQVTEHTDASHIIKIMRDFTGPTNPRKQKQKTLPHVEDQHGQICSTPAEARQVWIQFFAEVEGGRRQSYADLQADWVQALEEEQSQEFTLSVQQLPTLTDLEIAFRRVASGKATGPDGVPGELCHLAPKHCARSNFAALWKLILHGHEALQYKGGLLVQAYKGSGEKTKCTSFRSLLISSHIGKAIHRTMRTTQATVFESFLQTQQLAGNFSPMCGWLP